MTAVTSSIQVVRRPEKFISDDRRVITRFFNIGGEDRVRSVIRRVMTLPEDEVEKLLDQVRQDFQGRHRRVEATLERNFEQVRRHIPESDHLSRSRRLLLGSYFTMEYAIESAALFNPSIVLHPDQNNLPEGSARFIMSLRATGEGHLSSIVFRTGVVDELGHLAFDPPSRFAASLRPREDRAYENKLFTLKLSEMGVLSDAARAVLAGLPAFFTLQQLQQRIEQVSHEPIPPNHTISLSEAGDIMLWLARSNYHLELPPDSDPSEIVIFPTSENESHGIEDLRLTRFVDDDEKVTYFGTFTAFNGYRILPQIIETDDFRYLKIHTLNGRYVQNKGMALFPRKIRGQYHMISRLDGENMFLMKSDNPYFWNQRQLLKPPHFPWEFIQVGNSGPPIETDAGWILLTHGVGPMRQYCIGATLLDRDNPARILGQLPDPLLAPEENERDGYVPNVVYTCGAMKHGNHLIIPYAMSDSATSFASVQVDELLDALTSPEAIKHNGRG